MLSVIRYGFRFPLAAVPKREFMSSHGSCVKHEQLVDEAIRELLLTECAREASWEEVEVRSPPVGCTTVGKS